MNLLWFASEEDSVSDFFKEEREREILVFTLFVNLSFQIKIISKAIYIFAHEWSVRFRENDVRPRHSKRDWETLAHILFSSAEVPFRQTACRNANYRSLLFVRSDATDRVREWSWWWWPVKKSWSTTTTTTTTERRRKDWCKKVNVISRLRLKIPQQQK